MSAPAARKFVFDTVFDDHGGVAYQPPPVKRSYTPEEVEAIRAAALAEGQASAVARAEEAAARAFAQIAEAAQAALSALAAVAHDHRTQAAELSLIAARKIADAALDHAPEAPAMAALEGLARELEGQPRLMVRVSPELLDRTAGELQAVAARIGFPGAILAKADPTLPAAAFVFDWADGRAAFDPQAAEARIAEAVAAALAAEGLHAEPLLSPET